MQRMALQQPFSKRNRYVGPAKEITIREDAPENLRYFVLQTAIDLGWSPSALRDVMCRVLRKAPDEGIGASIRTSGGKSKA